MKYVVGSGPAGVACAKRLVEAGASVTLVDVGLGLEPERQKHVERLSKYSGHQWRDNDEVRQIVRDMKDEMLETMDGGPAPTKLRYGSDYPYRGTEEALQIERDAVGGSASFAKGGLSTVWGGGALPFRDSDLGSWPIGAEELDPYYRDAFDTMGLVAERDNLDTLFETYHDDPSTLERSNQANEWLDLLGTNTQSLNDHGIYFGASRLALGLDTDDACPHCGLKLFGCCPRGTVYSSAETVRDLEDSDVFEYVSGVIVEEVHESDGTVTISGRSHEDGSPERFTGDRVFLACGAIPTTKILLRSLEMYDRTVSLQEPLYFVLPLLRLTGNSHDTTDRVSTLAQIFLEITDPAVSERTVHLSIYTYNELLKEILEARDGLPSRLATAVGSPLLGRLMVAMCYLHSDHGPDIDVHLTEDGELQMMGSQAATAGASLRSVVWKLFKNGRLLRTLPIFPAVDVKQPGESFHVGGSFPMRESPGETETDTLGRPPQYDRVHAVDATVFPDVPATTFTATIMANAARIADQYVKG